VASHFWRQLNRSYASSLFYISLRWPLRGGVRGLGPGGGGTSYKMVLHMLEILGYQNYNSSTQFTVSNQWFMSLLPSLGYQIKDFWLFSTRFRVSNQWFLPTSLGLGLSQFGSICNTILYEVPLLGVWAKWPKTVMREKIDARVFPRFILREVNLHRFKTFEIWSVMLFVEQRYPLYERVHRKTFHCLTYVLPYGYQLYIEVPSINKYVRISWKPSLK
jgi:hypothetical protein